MNARLRTTFSAILLAAGFAAAQPLQLDMPTEATVFRPYGLVGPSFGTFAPVSEPFTDQAGVFARAGIASQFMFLPLTGMTLDADATFPDGGFGGSLGLVQEVVPFVISPFAGASAGFRYVGTSDGREGKFSDRFGPTIGVNAGVRIFREGPVQVRAKAGYELILDAPRDQGAGFDIAILWALGRPGIRALANP
ncbi:MAG: hypothetical protein H6686_10120 [Fibrobacteria bacterium]|nr:hypothetical protein [Fibrobacteria bacterium]